MNIYFEQNGRQPKKHKMKWVDFESHFLAPEGNTQWAVDNDVIYTNTYMLILNTELYHFSHHKFYCNDTRNMTTEQGCWRVFPNLQTALMEKSLSIFQFRKFCSICTTNFL